MDIANPFPPRPALPATKSPVQDLGALTENLRTQLQSFEDNTQKILENHSGRIENVHGILEIIQKDLTNVKGSIDDAKNSLRTYVENFNKFQSTLERTIQEIVTREVARKLDRIMDILPHVGPDFFLNMMDQIGRRFQGMSTMPPPQPPSSVFPSAAHYMMPTATSALQAPSTSASYSIPRKSGRVQGPSAGSKQDETIPEDDEEFREEDRRRTKRQRDLDESTGEFDTSPPNKASRAKKNEDGGTGRRSERDRR